MKKLFQTLFLLVVAVSTIVVGTAAYFNAQATSPSNVFTVGSLAIQLAQNSGTNWPDWSPGESRELEFTIINTGSLPVHIKGFFDGAWNGGFNDTSLVTVESVEYYNNTTGNWETLIAAPLEMASEFYYSQDYGESTALALDSLQTLTMRMAVRLSETTTSDYQNSYFAGELHLAARQVTPGATWPATY